MTPEEASPDGGRSSAARVVLVACGLLMACERDDAAEPFLAVPGSEEWIDCGIQLVAGADGEWDRYLWGGFALAAGKLGDTYLLYYQGSSGYDEDEGTVTWRAIGLATSDDGVSLTKHAENPVLTWFPRQNLEEGAASLAAHVEPQRDLAHLYYGANTWMTQDQVNADGRYAISEDGVTLVERGVVLNHVDPSLWAFGDEVFPVAAFHEGRRRVVYYIPNGVEHSGTLGVAWGTDASFSRSSQVRDGDGGIAAWGPGGAARLGPGRYALFLSNIRGEDGPYVEARTVQARRPHRPGPPVARYWFENVSVATVLLDRARMRWLMYYRTETSEAIGVRMAPARVEGDAALPAWYGSCTTDAAGDPLPTGGSFHDDM